MPVTGLPNTLEILLEALLGENSLTSWNIFNEKNGTTCVKLRFTGQPLTLKSQSTVKPTSYRKVSDKQTLRNKQRAATFRKESDNLDSDGIMTRSKRKEIADIEKPRHSDSVAGISSTGDHCDLNISVVSVASNTWSTDSHTPLHACANTNPCQQPNIGSPISDYTKIPSNDLCNTPPNTSTQESKSDRLVLFDEAIITDTKSCIYAKTIDNCIYKYNPNPDPEESKYSCISKDSIQAWYMALVIEHSKINLHNPEQPEPPWWDSLIALHNFASDDYDMDS